MTDVSIPSSSGKRCDKRAVKAKPDLNIGGSQSLLHQGSGVTVRPTGHGSARPGRVSIPSSSGKRCDSVGKATAAAVAARMSQSLLHQGSAVTAAASAADTASGELTSQSLLHQGSAVTINVRETGEASCTMNVSIPSSSGKRCDPGTRHRRPAILRGRVSIPSSSGKRCD